MHGPNIKALNRSLKAYSWYIVFTRAYFWTPLFVLYFSTVISLKQIFVLEAIYYAAVFLLEVPSGYFSDRFGRKITLIISTISLSLAYVLFFIGGSFAMFTAAQICLAIGFSFSTGTDTSLHYALLTALNKEKEYGQREAKLSSQYYISIAVAAVLGGFFAWLGEYRVAYALSFIFAFLSFLLVASMRDPEKDVSDSKTQAHPFLQMNRVFRKLSDPTLKYLFVFTVIIVVLNHIPYELYQVYVKNALFELGNDALLNANPLILGFHTALSMLVASFFAKRAMGVQRRFGTKISLLLLVTLQTVLIASMGVHGSCIVILLLLMRGFPGAIQAPIVRSETTHKLESNLRATYFSTKSLLGRISFSLVLLLFSRLPGDGFGNSVIAGSVIGIAFIIILSILPLSKK